MYALLAQVRKKPPAVVNSEGNFQFPCFVNINLADVLAFKLADIS